MYREEFSQLLIDVVGSSLQKTNAHICYFPINPKDLTILCYDNDKRETMWVSEGWDVWRIYRDEDLTTQLNIIVKHYFKQNNGTTD
jgi:hypothetical protein